LNCSSVTPVRARKPAAPQVAGTSPVCRLRAAFFCSMTLRLAAYPNVGFLYRAAKLGMR
jgi:hypothetical protein